MSENKSIEHRLRAGKLQFDNIGNQGALKNPGRHYLRIAKKLENYRLAYKCRLRWRRRHLKGLIYSARVRADPIGEAIHSKILKYDKLLHYLKFEKWRKQINDGDHSTHQPT